MEDELELDLHIYKNQKKQLERLTSQRYWNEYNGNWKGYLTDVFKYDDIPTPFVKENKPIKIIKKEIHPFNEWI